MGSAVPRLLGYGRRHAAEGEVEYLVIACMAGRAERHVNLAGESRRALLYSTGLMLAQIHAVPAAPLLADEGLFPLDRDGAALDLPTCSAMLPVG